MDRIRLAGKLVRLAKMVLATKADVEQLKTILKRNFDYLSGDSNQYYAVFKYKGKGKDTGKVLTAAEGLLQRAGVRDYGGMEVEDVGRELRLSVPLGS